MPKRKPDPNQLTLTRFRGYYLIKKRRKAEAKIESELSQRPTPMITIPYRGDGRIRGAGAHFDHLTMQTITHADTTMANFSSAPTHLAEYVKNHTTSSSFRMPTEEVDIEKCNGLVFLPGIARATKEAGDETYITRQQSTDALIKDALLRGKPILSVCGGSWDVWMQAGGLLEDAKDHNCNQGMPRVNAEGKVGHNIQIHRIALTDHSYLLKGAMQFKKNQSKNPFPSVNSVHWKSPSRDKVPEMFAVSAYAVADNDLAPKNRQGEQMQPQVELIEAFETKHGAPVLCLQWHPEAYTANTKEDYFPAQQRGILNYMKEAGRTYQLKNNLIEELRRRVPQIRTSGTKTRVAKDVKIKLRRTGFLSSFFRTDYKNECLRLHNREKRGQILTLP